jgi:hypothetical protein
VDIFSPASGSRCPTLSGKTRLDLQRALRVKPRHTLKGRLVAAKNAAALLPKIILALSALLDL